MWGSEIDLNVKGTGGGANWPTSMQVFGVQVKGNSTVQPGDGGGGGIAYAFHVQELGINSHKKWSTGFVTGDASCTTGLSLGASAAAGASVDGQPLSLNYYDGSSTLQTIS